MKPKRTINPLGCRIVIKLDVAAIAPRSLQHQNYATCKAAKKAASESNSQTITLCTSLRVGVPGFMLGI